MQGPVSFLLENKKLRKPLITVFPFFLSEIPLKGKKDKIFFCNPIIKIDVWLIYMKTETS